MFASLLQLAQQTDVEIINPQAVQTAAMGPQFNWTNPSWDLFLILFFIVGAFLYGISLGRDRIIIILVALYMGLAVVESLPQTVVTVGINKIYAFEVTAFVSIFIVLFFLLSRSALLRTIGSNATQGSLWQIIIFSILHVGLMASIVMSLIPPAGLEKFSDRTVFIFTNEWAKFGWIIAPVLAMLLVKPKED